MEVVCTDAPDHLLKSAESMNEKNVENKLTKVEKYQENKWLYLLWMEDPVKSLLQAMEAYLFSFLHPGPENITLHM